MRRRSLAAAGVLLLAPLLGGCGAAPAATSQRAVPGTCVSNAHAPVTTAERGAARVAMAEPRFWRLIAVLHGSNADSAYAALTDRLARESSSDIVAFQVRLVLALRALDDECRADWYEHHDPTGLGSLADDDFLYVRADTVSAGEATWTEAIRTDTLPWGSTDAADGDGELLLYVAEDAAERRGLSFDAFSDLVEQRTDLDDETASNAAGWPPADPDDRSLNRL